MRDCDRSGGSRWSESDCAVLWNGRADFRWRLGKIGGLAVCLNEANMVAMIKCLAGDVGKDLVRLRAVLYFDVKSGSHDRLSLPGFAMRTYEGPKRILNNC